MANFIYTVAKKKILDGDIDFNLPDDFRVLLIMTNTTADTEKDKLNVGAFTTLDEMDGANYVRKALASEATSQDDANDRAEFDADNVTWTALGAGTRQVQGLILIKHVTNDADSIPIAFIDTGGFPFSASGADVTANFNVEGILQAT